MKVPFNYRWRGWVLWAGLFFGVLPIVNAAVIETAYIRSALDYDHYLSMLHYARDFGWPGLNIAKICGADPLFWVEHSTGWVFWKLLGEFLFFNILGWTAVFLLLDVLMETMRKIVKARRGGLIP